MAPIMASDLETETTLLDAALVRDTLTNLGLLYARLQDQRALLTIQIEDLRRKFENELDDLRRQSHELDRQIADVERGRQRWEKFLNVVPHKTTPPAPSGRPSSPRAKG